MTKAAAIYKFWSGFGLPAYEENSVPTGSEFPYITYQLVTDSFGSPTYMSASLWYYGTKWTDINAKAEQISRTIGKGGKSIPCDGGGIWITRGKPFAQNMREPDNDMIRRKLLNITAEYITND